MELTKVFPIHKGLKCMAAYSAKIKLLCFISMNTFFSRFQLPGQIGQGDTDFFFVKYFY